MANLLEKLGGIFSAPLTERNRNTKVNSQIEDRSYFVFEFPNGPTPNSNDTVRQVLNFAENIEIVETQKAKLSPLRPIGRNGDVYVHTGAESRGFNIKFNMTLQNLIQHQYYTENKNFKGLSKPEMKKLYGVQPSDNTRFVDQFTGVFNSFMEDKAKTFLPSGDFLDGATADVLTAETFTSPIDRLRAKREVRNDLREKYTKRTPAPKPKPPMETSDPEVNFKNKINAYDETFIDEMTEQELAAYTIQERQAMRQGGDPSRNAAIAQILFWSNLIRLSVMASTQYPHLGPPIIRFNHGIMYENVRCIAEDYSIVPGKEYGFDQKTLLPNVIRVQMKLKEVRLSQPVFDPKENYDNLVGWDDIINNGYTSLNSSITKRAD